MAKKCKTALVDPPNAMVRVIAEGLVEIDLDNTGAVCMFYLAFFQVVSDGEI